MAIAQRNELKRFAIPFFRDITLRQWVVGY